MATYEVREAQPAGSRPEAERTNAQGRDVSVNRSDTPPARHWSRDLPAYGADNCAGCGGTVPCGCDDEC